MSLDKANVLLPSMNLSIIDQVSLSFALSLCQSLTLSTIHGIYHLPFEFLSIFVGTEKFDLVVSSAGRDWIVVECYLLEGRNEKYRYHVVKCACSHSSKVVCIAPLRVPCVDQFLLMHALDTLWT